MKGWGEVFGPGGLADDERQAALIELCAVGLVTCTRGNPGSMGAKYALGWLPLDEPESYSEEVRKRHAENMRRLDQGGSEMPPSLKHSAD